MTLKRLIRKFVPESLMNRYHYLLARFAVLAYRNPSNELVVIGVTGTNGKSSTTQFIGQILEHAGARVGWTSTASFKIGEREWVNDKKMTMLGRCETQKFLREMVRAGCVYAIVETSSQGIAQSRHVGINYDVAVFTNLTPEHIEAHGGFEPYKKAKRELFVRTKHARRKKIPGARNPQAAMVRRNNNRGLSCGPRNRGPLRTPRSPDSIDHHADANRGRSGIPWDLPDSGFAYFVPSSVSRACACPFSPFPLPGRP